MPERLNLGCGTDIREGFVNLDSSALPGVDVVHELGSGPLPFEDASFDEILCKDVLEHVDLEAVLREIHRVLRPGGRVRVIAPHFSSAAVWVDPTHRRGFSIETFDFFSATGGGFSRSYYYDFHFARVERPRIIFHRYRWQPWNYLLEPLINRSPAIQNYFEQTFLARVFPAANIDLYLVR